MASLQKRGKRWYIRYWRAGCEHKKSLGKHVKTEAQAKRWLKEWEESHVASAQVLPFDASKISLAEFTARFLQLKQGLISDTSLKRYQVALKSLIDHLGEDFPLRSLTTARITQWAGHRRTTPRQYIDGRERDPVSAAGVNADLRHIRHALTFAVEDMECLAKAPRIKMLRTPKPLPRCLNQSELNRLLAIEEHSDRRRFWVACAWTGCRRSELLSLTWGDIHMEPWPMALVTGKGHKQRMVPLFSQVLEVIGKQGRAEEPVFLFNSRKRGQKKATLQAVHPDTVTHWFAQLAKRAGISARLHDLRHTYATTLISAGINPRFVQQLMGHESITTTEHYSGGAVVNLYEELNRTISGTLRIIK